MHAEQQRTINALPGMRIDEGPGTVTQNLAMGDMNLNRNLAFAQVMQQEPRNRDLGHAMAPSPALLVPYTQETFTQQLCYQPVPQPQALDDFIMLTSGLDYHLYRSYQQIWTSKI